MYFLPLPVFPSSTKLWLLVTEFYKFEQKFYKCSKVFHRTFSYCYLSGNCIIAAKNSIEPFRLLFPAVDAIAAVFLVWFGLGLFSFSLLCIDVGYINKPNI
uniref:Uncharacterized protein n=1 Tax=Rhizophora mucronata TaxID=61149 RepID=A0A2P2Q7M5_RHIMU